MDSSGRGAFGYAVGVGVRAALVGLTTFAATYLGVVHQLYATAAVLGLVGALVVVDIAWRASAADRVLAQFVDGLFAEGAERPASTVRRMQRLEGAMGRALDRLGRARSERQRRIDYLQTLSDTVSAALLVVDEDGAVTQANQAALKTLPPVQRLADLGAEAAERLERARFGAGEIVRLADGRAMFAQVAGFSTPEGGQRRLISLQRVAGELDAVELRAWSDLVRVLSHEIMNSLTPICSLAESSAALLPDQEGPAAEALAVIARRSAGLMSFVGRYREVFNLPVPERTRVRVADIVARTDALVASQMAEARVRYTSSVEDPGIVLDVDPDLIDQALINLLKNALEAVRGTSEAAVELAVTVEADLAAITVSDNGPGVPPDDLDSVFVPFFSRKAGGSGIGLSLTRQIAIAHGGRVEYRPREGGGAAFRLLLPIAAPSS